jgi:hypothetical protein
MTAIHPLWSFGRGDTFPISACLTDANGEALDLSGAQNIEWKLETAPAWPADPHCDPPTPTVALDLTIGNGVAVANETEGEITITVTAAQSSALAPGRYRDQLRVTTAEGIVSTQWVGFIDVKPTF